MYNNSIIDKLTKTRNNLINNVNNQLQQIDSLSELLEEMGQKQIKIEEPITKRVFFCQDKYDKFLESKQYQKALGLTATKCAYCTQTFYGDDISKHVQDGRCEKSRRCNGCGVVFNNMTSKHRHSCSKRMVDKRPLSPDPEPEQINTPIVKILDDLKLKTLEDTNTIDVDWYRDLHSDITNEDAKKEIEKNIEIMELFSAEFPLYLKENKLYYVEDDTEAWEVKHNGNHYKLIDLAEEEEEEEIKDYSKLERIDQEQIASVLCDLDPDSNLLELIESDENFDETVYINLHKNKSGFTPEIQRQFQDNISDIIDSKYCNGDYMYYSDGHLKLGDENLFRIFKNGVIYDLEAIETNSSDEDTY